MSEYQGSYPEVMGAGAAQTSLSPEGVEGTARLRQKASHYRCLEVTTTEGAFEVEYKARGMGAEQVRVNGQIADRCRSTWWYSPCFRFQLGSSVGQLLVRYWPWLGLRSLKLIVDGRVLYTEGAAEATVTADELAGLMSERLVSGGIQVVGEPLAVVSPHRNIQCEKRGSSITLRQRWFSWMAAISSPIAVVYDALLVGIYAFALVQRAPVWVYVLLLPLLLAGLIFTYYVVARLVNRTEVVLAPGQLSVCHRPLPWPGSRKIPLSHVKCLLCRETTLRDSDGDAWPVYTLAVRLEDGREVELLTKIGTLETAQYLEQEVQGWLRAGAKLAVSS